MSFQPQGQKRIQTKVKKNFFSIIIYLLHMKCDSRFCLSSKIPLSQMIVSYLLFIIKKFCYYCIYFFFFVETDIVFNHYKFLCFEEKEKKYTHMYMYIGKLVVAFFDIVDF